MRSVSLKVEKVYIYIDIYPAKLARVGLHACCRLDSAFRCGFLHPTFGFGFGFVLFRMRRICMLAVVEL